MQINLNDDEFTEYVKGMIEDDYALNDKIHDIIFTAIGRNDITILLFDEIEADAVVDPELLDKLNSLSSENIHLIQQKELNIPDQMVSIPLLDEYQHDPFVFRMCCSGKLSVFDNYHDRIKDAIYDGFNDIKPKLMTIFPDEDIPETSQMNLDVYLQYFRGQNTHIFAVGIDHSNPKYISHATNILKTYDSFMDNIRDIGNDITNGDVNDAGWFDDYYTETQIELSPLNPDSIGGSIDNGELITDEEFGAEITGEGLKQTKDDGTLISDTEINTDGDKTKIEHVTHDRW
eukprot:CAMPEP_0114672776 /NCGR_PEP_ID=MMETSP0191-20121206/43479_1 /TAXON_ID=126664 /ORGANISM="Sorites sp." /LENGTH=288 /DNA_ID=CAMNT_0001935923 /DNA_START=3408 /DNA_END=4271 /DNA_ORIENTATION=+